MSYIRSQLSHFQVSVINQWGMANRDQKAVERFFNNSNVKVEELIEQVRAECGERCPEEHVLVLQDTSELNYNSLNGKLKVQDKDLGVFVR